MRKLQNIIKLRSKECIIKSKEKPEKYQWNISTNFLQKHNKQHSQNIHFIRWVIFFKQRLGDDLLKTVLRALTAREVVRNTGLESGVNWTVRIVTADACLFKQWCNYPICSTLYGT